ERGIRQAPKMRLPLDENIAQPRLLNQSREGGDGVGFADKSPGLWQQQPCQDDLADCVDEFGAQRLRSEPEETGDGFLSQRAGLRPWRRGGKLQGAVRQRNRLKKPTASSNIAARTLRDNGHSGGRETLEFLLLNASPQPLILRHRLRLLLDLLNNEVAFFWRHIPRHPPLRIDPLKSHLFDFLRHAAHMG